MLTSREKQLIRGIFYFSDATSIITKQTTWAERDKAMEEGGEALNNSNVKKYSADSQARFGCKGSDVVTLACAGVVALLACVLFRDE